LTAVLNITKEIHMQQREHELMSINQSHQRLMGSIMVQNKELIEDLKAVSRILNTSNYLDNVSELKLKALKEILQPYQELDL